MDKNTSNFRPTFKLHSNFSLKATNFKTIPPKTLIHRTKSTLITPQVIKLPKIQHQPVNKSVGTIQNFQKFSLKPTNSKTTIPKTLNHNDSNQINMNNTTTYLTFPNSVFVSDWNSGHISFAAYSSTVVI